MMVTGVGFDFAVQRTVGSNTARDLSRVQPHAGQKMTAADDDKHRQIAIIDHSLSVRIFTSTKYNCNHTRDARDLINLIIKYHAHNY